MMPWKSVRHIVRAAALVALALPASVPTARAQPVELPYWASTRSDTINMRAGPGRSYPVRWRYVRAGVPLRVLRANEGWRYVEDADGQRGWILGSLLSRRRAALVIGAERVPMRAEPAPSARLRWWLAPGVTGYLGECRQGWCMLDVAGHSGWVEARALWGAQSP